MMKGVLLLLLSLVSGLTLSVSESQSASLLPHAHDSFNISYIRMKNAGSCSYLAVISTSCSSPRYTNDQISIAFGDAYGNQIYAPRLDDPASGTFESCSSDTFQINGPCADQICYVYLYRSGNDGWKPESVKINGYNGRPVTFYYNTFIAVCSNSIRSLANVEIVLATFFNEFLEVFIGDLRDITVTVKIAPFH